jgi:hypothetical protein
MNHRIARWGLLAAAAIALSGVASAQNVPAQFVVSGKAAEKIQDFATINLATAQNLGCPTPGKRSRGTWAAVALGMLRGHRQIVAEYKAEFDIRTFERLR